MRHVVLLVVAVAGLSVQASASDVAGDSAVVEAAFRQQIDEHLDASARAAGTVLCAAVVPGGSVQSPSEALLLRLIGKGRIRRVSECEKRPKGAVERLTGRPAIIVVVGPIEWVAEDDARVSVSYYRTARMSATRRYRVVREPSGWVSLGPVVIDGPA